MKRFLIEREGYGGFFWSCEVDMGDREDHEKAAEDVVKRNWANWEHPEEVDLVVTLIATENSWKPAPMEAWLQEWHDRWFDKPVKVSVTVAMEPEFRGTAEWPPVTGEQETKDE